MLLNCIWWGGSSPRREWSTSSFIDITEWNDKIVVLKKTPLQLYFKTFIENINSGNLIM